MGSWDFFKVCHGCNDIEHLGWKDTTKLNHGCCPKCGGEKFEMKKLRWNTSRCKFYNPFTWNKGFWEEWHERNK